MGEHARTAQRDVVAAVNLVGLDPEPLAGVAILTPAHTALRSRMPPAPRLITLVG
jgi:hypothetical protein